MGGRLGAGPLGLPAAHDVNPQRHLHRGLQPLSHNLAVSLGGVTITQKEQRPFLRHGKVERGPAHCAAPIHVAAVGARGGRGDRLAARRRHTQAT